MDSMDNTGFVIYFFYISENCNSLLLGFIFKMMHHCCIQSYFPWWITMMQNRITPLPQGELAWM